MVQKLTSTARFDALNTWIASVEGWLEFGAQCRPEDLDAVGVRSILTMTISGDLYNTLVR